MEWFGWLTKPHLMVTFLDKIIMVAELAVVIFSASFLFFTFDDWKKKKRKKRVI